MKFLAPPIGALLLLLAFPAAALAGEGLFSRVYTTETVPQGHFELEQLVRHRTERSFGSYNSVDLRSEFEYGVTDSFQAAFYLNTGWIDAKDAPDDNDPNGETGFSRNGFYLQGFSLELIYRVLSPISDPIGLAFYIEPEVTLHDPHNGLRTYDSYTTEYRVLVQKNFFEDQLILAYNMVFEPEYFRYDPYEPFTSELDWNNELGATYRVASNWYVGFELRNHNELDNFNRHDHSVLWLGPSIHYGGPSAWATLGILRQVAGNPDGFTDAGSFIGNGLFLHSHEKWESTLKVGFPF